MHLSSAVRDGQLTDVCVKGFDAKLLHLRRKEVLNAETRRKFGRFGPR